MSTTYRVVSRNLNTIKSMSEGHIEGVLSVNRTLSTPENVEIRSSDGDIWRLKKGSDFLLRETAEGLQPVIAGEVFSIVIKSWHKSSTRSCYTCAFHSSPAVMSLTKPSSSNPNADEYFCLQGDFVIHEFDEQGRHFVIATVEAGDHVTLEINEAKPMRDRYSVSKRRLSDAEIDMLLSDYVDPRKWSL